MGTTLAPNHVAINTKRKHIDADTSWLEPKKGGTQQVPLRSQIVKCSEQFTVSTVCKTTVVGTQFISDASCLEIVGKF